MLWRTDPNEVPALHRVYAAFTAANPGITVNPIIVTWANYEPKLSAMIAAGTPPDLFSSVGASGFVDYAIRGLGLDQSSLIKTAHLDTSDFYPAAMSALQWKGQQLALPLGGGPTLMFYNVDMFKKAGLALPPTDWNDTTWTWDKMVQDAKLLTLDTSGRNATDPNFDWKHTAQWGINPGLWPQNDYAWLWGCDWFPIQTGIPSHATFNTPCVVNSLQRLADLSVKYHVAPNPEQQQLFKTFADPFISGKIAMGMTGVWFMQNNHSFIKNRFPWAVATLPKGTTRLGVLFTDPMMISKGSKNPMDAFQFVKYLTSKPGQEIFINGYVGLSMRKSEIHLLDLKSPPPSAQAKSAVYQAVVGAFAHSRESSNHNIAQYAAIDNLMNAELAPMYNGQKTAAQVAVVIQAKMDALFTQMHKQYGGGQ
jgi:multiple sugar transport system substrate-binding protein